ncbi:MAG: hypothetical protein QNJ09_18145 [Paracoccaceae bacterium]|nr:hypothetical protein [Paracoccaceae bacterium]
MKWIATVLALVMAVPAAAQDAVFDSYDALRDKLDSLMMAREIEELMIAFGGADEMTIQQLQNLDMQVEGIYPENFTDVAIIRRTAHENGWRQELLAYWTGLSYIYAYVLVHDTGQNVIAVNFRFNSDFAELNALF